MISKSTKSSRKANPRTVSSKLDKLKKRGVYLSGDPEDIVHMDGSSEWTELRNFEPDLPQTSKRREE